MGPGASDGSREATSLLLVAPGLPAPTGRLELGALDEQGVLASGGPQGELVEGDDLTSSLQDPLPDLLSHPEGAQGQLGHVEDAEVVGDGAHADGQLGGVTLALQVPHQASQGERGAVDLAHEEPPKDDLVELGVGPAGEEPVELDEQPQVDVLGLWLGPPDLPVMLVAHVDRHGCFSCRSESSNK